MAVVLAVVSALMTLVGGIVAMRVRDHRHLVLGLVGGLILGIAAFDLVPESLELSDLSWLGVPAPMAGFACGFLLLHVIEQATAIHQAHESEYAPHRHRHGHGHAAQDPAAQDPAAQDPAVLDPAVLDPAVLDPAVLDPAVLDPAVLDPAVLDHGNEQGKVGLVAASALVGHSFVDGLSIGLGFQSGSSVGLLVALAVIAHDFADGFNTFTAASLNRTDRGPAIALLAADAAAPVAGALITMLVEVPREVLGPYLGFFAGVLLYLAAAEILPEAHSRHPRVLTLCATGAGVLAVMFIVGIAG